MADHVASEGHDDDLRRMLAGLDPMSARVPVEALTSPRARDLMEQIMSMEVTETSSEQPAAGRRMTRGRTWLTAAASVAVLGLGVGVGIAVNDGTGTGTGTGGTPTTLALTAPGGDPTVIQSCVMLTAEALRPVPMALAATVINLGAKTVTLDVERWYKGGDADQVTIALPPGDISPALIPGVDFAEGEKFLITAFDNVVNGCGFSGPATAELQKIYTEAFGG